MHLLEEHKKYMISYGVKQNVLYNFTTSLVNKIKNFITRYKQSLQDKSNTKIKILNYYQQYITAANNKYIPINFIRNNNLKLSQLLSLKL